MTIEADIDEEELARLIRKQGQVPPIEQVKQQEYNEFWSDPCWSEKGDS